MQTDISMEMCDDMCELVLVHRTEKHKERGTERDSESG